MQVASLGPQDEVLVIGSTRDPGACLGPDQQALSELFDLQIFVPLPSFADRRVSSLHLCIAAPKILDAE